MKNTIIYDSFKTADLSDMNFPMITVFNNTSDIPGKYSARIFECIPSVRPTNYVIVRNNFEEIKKDIFDNFSVVNLNRTEKDDPVIVCTFLII